MIQGIPRLAGNIPSRSVRYVPSAELNAARTDTQQALKRLFTPSENPISDLADEIAARSPMNPNQLARLRGETYEAEKALAILAGTTRRELLPSGSNEAISILSRDLPLLQPGMEPVSISVAPGTGGYALVKNNQPVIDVKGKNPYSQASTLAHELGHTYANHTLPTSDPQSRYSIGYGPRELEAEAIGYGAMNRLYPWNRKGREVSAARGIVDQLNDWSEMSGYPDRAVNPVTYLRHPGHNAYLNQIVQTIVPEPRQPFRNILPAIYQ